MGGNRNNYFVNERQEYKVNYGRPRGKQGTWPNRYSKNRNSNFQGHDDRVGTSRPRNMRGGRGGGRNFRRGGFRGGLDDGDVQMKPRGPRNRHDYAGGYGGNKKKFVNYHATWHKIIIFEAAIYTKEEVLATIKELIDEEFVPFMMEVEDSNMVFYLERNANVVRALVNMSGRFTIGSNKIYISCSESTPPTRKLTPEQLEIIKSVMADRYAVELQRIDLKNFHNDKILVREQIFCPLYRPPNAECVLKILLENCVMVEEIDLSQNQLVSLNDWQLLKNCVNLKRLCLEKNRLKHIDALQKLKGLQITQITLENNHLCSKYESAEKYKSDVREIFPKIELLDGVELGKPIGFEVGDEGTLPPVLPSFFNSDEIKGVVVQFIEQYFQVFESENRKPLEAAYTESAFFSLSANFPDSGPGHKFGRPFSTLSRNLKIIVNPTKREKLLFKGRDAISEALSKIPQCIHDPSSFVIDIPFAQPVLMHVVLTGLFKQTNIKTPIYRNFMKSMIIVPVGSGFCISNEELYLNTASVEQIRVAVKNATPSATPASSAPGSSQIASPNTIPITNEDPLAGLQPAQIELMKQFALHSNMLPQYCRMCLESNEWDFNKAGEMFLNLQKENKIPPEYFAGIKSP